jgi:hypothetical protein
MNREVKTRIDFAVELKTWRFLPSFFGLGWMSISHAYIM